VTCFNSQTRITEAIASVKYGSPLPDSTPSIFFNQLATDPLAAPLEDANTALQNTFFSFLKNPWVLVAGTALLFFLLGGGTWIRNKLSL
jgi:hypothetical protein